MNWSSSNLYSNTVLSYGNVLLTCTFDAEEHFKSDTLRLVLFGRLSLSIDLICTFTRGWLLGTFYSTGCRVGTSEPRDSETVSCFQKEKSSVFLFLNWISKRSSCWTDWSSFVPGGWFCFSDFTRGQWRQHEASCDSRIPETERDVKKTEIKITFLFSPWRHYSYWYGVTSRGSDEPVELWLIWWRQFHLDRK